MDGTAMANPQLEDGYLRIANEIWDQVMMTKFNAAQRGILDLVIRLSYGCGKKWAYIPRQKDFCLAGLYESHVKRELERLEQANVLWIDWGQRLYQLNKNYKAWRVSLSPGYDEERLKNLVSENLQRSKNQGQNLQISKNKNLQISKNLHFSKLDLTNMEVLDPANQHLDDVRGTPKDSIKDISTAAADQGGLEKSDFELPFSPPEQESAINYWQRVAARLLNSRQVEILNAYRDDGFPDDVIKAAMDKALLAGADLRYAFSVLDSWRTKGIFTLEGVERETAEYRARTGDNKPNSQNDGPNYELATNYLEVTANEVD